ncbi:MAG: hypothetical protein KDE27_25640 [Planctomycetes bacterium]|nr:hypothetical protein [Planctomycetota bacterium]
MKTLLAVSLATATLVAQHAQSGPDPQQPSNGFVKSSAPLPIKHGVPAATDVVVPSEAVPHPQQIAGSPTRSDRNPPVAAALADAIAAFDDPEFVAIDDGDPVTIWATGAGYKAAFDAGSWRFIGRPAARAPELQPIDFRLVNARVDEHPIELRTASRSRTDHRIQFDHGGLRETVDISGRGVEQTFVFDRLPQRGELVLDIAVDTALRAEASADGIRFTGEFDDVRYSPAIAIDARGATVAAPLELAAGRLTIRVPAGFVNQATLPLRIDPWVTAAAVYNTTNDVASPDIAWDETGQVWAIVYSRHFGGTDWDCYVQRLGFGNPMPLIGGPTLIDGSTAAWVRPRIAGLKVYAGLMVVAQVKSGSNPWNVSGRIMANSGSNTTAQFVVAASNVDELHPDIGADSGAPPAYFTVVWEHAYSPTDHDIYARQVDISGALRGANPTYVQTSPVNQTWPSISKSAGGLPAATQRFAIVYQQTFSGSDEDIYAALLTRDGALAQTNVGVDFPVSTLSTNEILPQVSSPTLPEYAGGNRTMLAVFEKTNVGNGDIGAACFDLDGVVRDNINVSALEQLPSRLGWPQRQPCVETDGRRFVVGYHEQFNGDPNLNDLDTRVTVVALGPGGLFAEEAGTALAASNIAREFSMQICSRYSGTGLLSPHFNTTHDRDGIGVNQFGIDAYSFDLVPFGRFATRSTACGTLAIQATGQAIPGGVVSFTRAGQPGLQGYVVGLPVSTPVGPCPSCTLGVDGFAVIGASYAFPVPSNTAIVGWQFAAQGFVFVPAGAPCLGQIEFSDTVDFTIG